MTAAVRPYLRYDASQALRDARPTGSMVAWPRLAITVAERHAAGPNARTTWTTICALARDT